MNRKFTPQMESFRNPAELGDMGFRHEVHVFVFRVCGGGIEYLLLQPAPQHEGVWRPVIHPVAHDEQLRHAALRGVRTEIGLERPFDLLTTGQALVRDLGDLRLIEWPFAFQTRQPDSLVQRGSLFADAQWKPFDDAVRMVTDALDRQNLLQIHYELVA